MLSPVYFYGFSAQTVTTSTRAYDTLQQCAANRV